MDKELESIARVAETVRDRETYAAHDDVDTMAVWTYGKDRAVKMNLHNAEVFLTWGAHTELCVGDADLSQFDDLIAGLQSARDLAKRMKEAGAKRLVKR